MNGSFIHHVTSGRNLRQRTQYLVSISCFNVLRHFAGRGSRFSIWRAAFTRHEELLHILRISCWYSPHLVLIVFWRQDHIPRGRALACTILLSSLQIHVAIAHDMYTLCICRKFIYIYIYSLMLYVVLLSGIRVNRLSTVPTRIYHQLAR